MSCIRREQGYVSSQFALPYAYASDLIVPLESYHRAEFLGILADQLPSNYRPHFGKRLVSYTDPPSGPVTLHFKDGTTATCDVLVAADGIKSAVRRAMYEGLAESESDAEKAEKLRGFVKAKWTGQYVYRGLVPRERVEEVCPDHPALSGPVYVSAHRDVRPSASTSDL